MINQTTEKRYQHQTAMKHWMVGAILGMLISCCAKKTLALDAIHVERIEIYRGYLGQQVQMKAGFEKSFLADLNQASEVGPTKFGKTHHILVHYTHQAPDTIYTNGELHLYKNLYESEEDLIKKYAAEY